MTDNSPLSAIKQVEQEHEELRELIGTIHKTLADPTSTVTQVREKLVALCDKLESHFRTEEEDGFFTQITDQAPRLTDQADKLCDEHRTMLDEAKSLAIRAIRCDQFHELQQEIQPAFHEFSKHLMHHESEENEMLQEAYWEDIGPGD